MTSRFRTKPQRVSSLPTISMDGITKPLAARLQEGHGLMDRLLGKAKPFPDIGDYFLFCSALGFFCCKYRFNSFNESGSIQIV
jgi:hypothetical protein